MSKIPVIAVPVASDADRSGYYALGLLMAYAKTYREGVLLDDYEFHPVSPFAERDVDAFLARIDLSRPSVFLFSVFVWNHEHSLRVAKKIRALSPKSLIVFGGANVPRRKADAIAFMNECQVIDVMGLGEGEELIAEMLAALAPLYQQTGELRFYDLSAVSGLVYRKKDLHSVMTTPRGLIKDVDSIPSPYLAGVFDESAIRDFYMLVTETTRGCPFGCTFCDWGGQTLSKVRKFGDQRLKDEMEFFFDLGVRNVSLADANFGMLKRDVELTDFIVDLRKKRGWPDSFTMNVAKNSADRVAEISVKLFKAGLEGGRLAIALQTTDQDTLVNIARDNIRLSDYERMLEMFRKNKISMLAEIMLGLPGQTYETFLKDLQACFEWMILPCVYPTRVMPNAPMGDPEYRKKYQIEVDEEGYAISSFSYTEGDRSRMVLLKMVDSVFCQQNMFKFLLMYFQVDKKVDALQIISRLIDLPANGDDSKGFDDLSWLIYFIDDHVVEHTKDWMMIGWSHEEGIYLHEKLLCIYDQFFQFVESEFSVSVSEKEKSSLIAVQMAAFSMKGRKLPEKIPVALDVVAYLKQLMELISLKNIPPDVRPLGSFGCGEINVPKQPVRVRKGFHQKDVRESEWPLKVQGLEVL